MTTWRRLVGGMLAAALITSTLIGTAAAQQPSNDQAARNHFLAGTSYYEQARYELALTEFLEAYRLSGRVELLVNASRAAERNLDFTQAIALVDQFLVSAPADHPQRAAETARRASLVELQARMPPRPTTVTPEPETDPETEPEVVPEEPRRRMGTLGFVGIGTMGGGAALGIVSLATGLVANSRYGDLDSSCPGGACSPSQQDDIDSGRRLARVSTATTFVGAGVLIAGLVLVLVDPGRPAEDAAPTAGLTITPGPGDAGLGLGWSF